jgi:hypothetical protein
MGDSSCHLKSDSASLDESGISRGLPALYSLSGEKKACFACLHASIHWQLWSYWREEFGS